MNYLILMIIHNKSPDKAIDCSSHVEGGGGGGGGGGGARLYAAGNWVYNLRYHSIILK